jgi:hypothetical protein
MSDCGAVGISVYGTITAEVDGKRKTQSFYGTTDFGTITSDGTRTDGDGS